MTNHTTLLYEKLRADCDKIADERLELAIANSKLKALIQRVNEIGPNLFNDEGDVSGGFAGRSSELEQLLKDCREAVS